MPDRDRAHGLFELKVNTTIAGLPPFLNNLFGWSLVWALEVVVEGILLKLSCKLLWGRALFASLVSNTIIHLTGFVIFTAFGEAIFSR